MRSIDTMLTKGKLYKIYVNDEYYKTIIVENAGTSIVTNSFDYSIDMEIHTYDKYVSVIGKTDEGLIPFNTTFTDLTNKNNAPVIYQYSLSDIENEFHFYYTDLTNEFDMENETAPHLISINVYSEDVNITKEFVLYPTTTPDKSFENIVASFVLVAILLLTLLSSNRNNFV